MLTRVEFPLPARFASRDGKQHAAAYRGRKLYAAEREQVLEPELGPRTGHSHPQGTPVSGAVPYQTTATIGRTDDSDTNGAVVDVVEDYQSPVNDIALAKLATPVYGIKPLELATTAPAAGEIVRIAGWGSLSDVNPTPATHLQTGQFTITAVSGTVVNLAGYQPEATTSACVYDSGAPYFAEPWHGRPRLVSVESDGPSCPDTGPETTSRVDTIASWAEETMAAR